MVKTPEETAKPEAPVKEARKKVEAPKAEVPVEEAAKVTEETSQPEKSKEKSYKSSTACRGKNNAGRKSSGSFRIC